MLLVNYFPTHLRATLQIGRILYLLIRSKTVTYTALLVKPVR